MISQGLWGQKFHDGLDMLGALTVTLKKAKILEENSNYGFDNYVCLLGAFIRESKSVKWSTTLEPGKTYVLIGGGDDDATDIDIIVRYPNGNIIAKDNDPDNNPVVSWTTNSYGKYSFELKLYSSLTYGSFCALAIMRKYANTVPTNNMATAMASSYLLWENLEELANVKFHDLNNQWCLFGMILDSGQNQITTSINLGNDEHIFVSTGDDNSIDIDLCVTNNSKRALKCDEESDSTPMVRYYSSNSYYYGLKTKNIRSRGKSFIITSILTN
jgi:hypothetical protein